MGRRAGQRDVSIAVGKMASRRVSNRLQVEYIDVAVPGNQVLSVPRFHSADMDELVGKGTVDIGLLSRTKMFRRARFIVVDKGAGRKKAIRSADHETAGMAKPVLFQQLEYWPIGTISAPHLVHKGRPKVVDLLAVAPWAALRHGLRVWKMESSGRPAVLMVSGQKPVCLPALASRPSVCLLEALHDAGWAQGQSPPAHSLTSPRVFDVTNPIASRAYLACLLELADILGHEAAECLAAGDNHGYFACVMARRPAKGLPTGGDRRCVQTLAGGWICPIPGPNGHCGRGALCQQ